MSAASALLVSSLCRDGMDRRRRLHTECNHHVVAELSTLIAEIFGRSFVSQVLPPEALLCRRCLRSVEKKLKLKSELLQKEQEIKLQIKKAGFAHGLEEHRPDTRSSLAATPTRTTPTRKRLRDSGDCTPKAKRRVTFGSSTPVRQFISSVIPSKTSPTVAVVVKGRVGTKLKTRIVRKASKLKTLTRSIGRMNYKSIARQAMKVTKIRDRILTILAADIQKELTSMCSRKEKSILRGTCSESMKTFTWDALVTEMEVRAPTLIQVLRGIVHVKRRIRPQASSKKKRRTYRPSEKAVLGVCASIVLKHRNVHMNILQRIVSLILHDGHASKETYTRLQKLLFCLSHKRTLVCLDDLGLKYDEKVKQWKSNLEETLPNPQLIISSDAPGSGFDTSAQVVSASPLPSSSSTAEDICCSDEEVHVSSADNWSDSSGEESSASACSKTGTESDSESSTSPTTEPSELDIDAFLGPDTQPPSSPKLKTYKIVGDNIDRNVRPREMRVDHQTRSLHYFHSYAIRDRVDLSEFSSEIKLPDVSQISLDNFLPSSKDEEIMKKNFAVLIGRVLMKHVPFFKKFGRGCLESHIQHEYSEEMARKSEVVPLGIYLKGEQSYQEMIEVLDHLHQYVPSTSTEEIVDAPDGSCVKATETSFHHTLFGGDQMTAARIRGSKGVMSNSEDGTGRLEGFLPVVEDWHAKMCLLEVFWKRMYSASSMTDGGTLYQLRNLIQRHNVVNNPKNSFTACEDFFLLVVEAHIVAAALKVFDMASVDDQPCQSLFPDGSMELNSLERRNVMMLAIKKVVDSYIDLSFGRKQPTKQKISKKPTKKAAKMKSAENVEDRVHSYACGVLTHGLLYMEFGDAIKEGDGHRDLRCWRYFMLLFKVTRRQNYSGEAFNLLAQYHFLLSPRAAMQLLWNRTVNVHGLPGRNVSCDLHMEHLNRAAKNGMVGIGSNITDEAIQRVGKSVGETMTILHDFDSTNEVKHPSGRHSKRSTAKDMKIILKQLQDSKVFEDVPHRFHKAFPQFVANPTRYLSVNNTTQWMGEKLQKLLTTVCYE